VLSFLFSAVDSPAALAIFRLLTGFAFIGLYVSIESWLNGTVPNERRGQIIGTYAAINYLALAAGQFLLIIGDPTGKLRFGLITALFSAAVIPVSLLEGGPLKVSDEFLEPVPGQTWRAVLQVMTQSIPIAVPGCVLTGSLYSVFCIADAGLPCGNWVYDVGTVRIYGHLSARRTCRAVADRSRIGPHRPVAARVFFCVDVTCAECRAYPLSGAPSSLASDAHLCRGDVCPV
jgi:MFS family permease